MDHTDVVEYVAYEYYTNDLTDFSICLKEPLARVGSIAVPLLFSTVVLLSLVGNILVLVILGLYENLRSLTNILILSLALSDLMFTLGLPLWSSQYIWGWTFGDAVCKGVNFVFSAGFYSSTVLLMLMTIQCYVAVVHPLSDWERGQRFAAVPILAWVVSFGAAIPALLYSEVMGDPEDSNVVYCEFNSIHTKNQQNIFFVIAFLVVAFCYVRILQTTCRKTKRHRTERLIFWIAAVFFVGWAPYNIVIFLRTLTEHQVEPFTHCEVSTHLDYAHHVCQLLAFSHCCLKPVCYVSVRFRNHFKRVLRKMFRSQTSPASEF
ncbi:chemokine XC receptor 1-like [Pygocentrus nattereri]|uniref:G-protein coupled receptors family 1 profile domain-containing protein n=1 Tax=Pygocentrus nattereri TaxID=42514 RepID=A0A3B4CYA6_PYGNA|nr:chemokine XC receptor 1-like [Pygocentrus nattereri]